MFDVACIGISVANAITKTVDKIPESGTGLVEEKNEPDFKVDVLSKFLFEIIELPNIEISFSETRFGKTVDRITVYDNGRLVFTFFVGKDITVEL